MTLTCDVFANYNRVHFNSVKNRQTHYVLTNSTTHRLVVKEKVPMSSSKANLSQITCGPVNKTGGVDQVNNS